MTDARAKDVLEQIVELAGQISYGVDLVDNRGPLNKAESIEIVSIPEMTVTASGATGASGQTVAPGILTLTCNLDPAIFVDVDKVAQIQTARGNWAAGLAREGLTQLKESVDSTFLTYLAKTLNYSSSAAYTDNVAADSLAAEDFANAYAGITSQRGASYQDLIGIIHPYALASLQKVAGFTPAQATSTPTSLGLKNIGSVHGVPMYLSNKVPRRRTVSATAWAITGTTTHTITVASGHGIVPGMKYTFDTVTAAGDLATAVAVTSVTDTTIVYVTTGLSNGSATEAGTITVECCENLIMDRSKMHITQQIIPGVEVIPLADKVKDQMQFYTLWGRIGRAAYCRTLCSPPSGA